MEEGIRDAVITLSVEVAGLFRAFDCQARGRRLQAIRRWRVSYILVVVVEEACRNDIRKMISKHPPTQGALCYHAVLGLAWDVSRRFYIHHIHLYSTLHPFASFDFTRDHHR